jgi:hypothetical protein
MIFQSLRRDILRIKEKGERIKEKGGRALFKLIEFI